MSNSSSETIFNIDTKLSKLGYKIYPCVPDTSTGWEKRLSAFCTFSYMEVVKTTIRTSNSSSSEAILTPNLTTKHFLVFLIL